MVDNLRGAARSTSPTDDGPKPNPSDIALAEVYAGSDLTQESAATSNEMLEAKKALNRRREGVKILLLGQSESGKSAILRNFQLAFAPERFEGGPDTDVWGLQKTKKKKKRKTKKKKGKEAEEGNLTQQSSLGSNDDKSPTAVAK